MTPEEIARCRAIIQADEERVRQARELAALDLGPAPCQHTKPMEFIDWCAEFVELAREKFARLI